MRLGVIGAGVIGKLRIQSILDHPKTELAAVMDLSLDAANAAAGGQAPAYQELDAFFDAGVDAVFVSTPPQFHEQSCVAALQRGLHVLCEKPLANSLEASQRIVDAAVTADRVLAVGFNMRYYPAMKFVRNAIDEGLIGDLDYLRLLGGHEGLSQFRADWQYKAPASGGGAMWDIGIHITDLARYLMGEITSVYGVATERVWQVPGSEDNAIVILKNPTGVAAQYQASWTEWQGYQFFVEAYGSRGMVRGSYAPMRNLLITMDRPGENAKTVRKFYPDIMVREKLKSWETTALLSFSEELDDFIEMAEGETGLRLADGYAGLRSIEVAHAVKESMINGAEVQLAELGSMRS